ncbi:hypothetical protein EHO66_00050, partial [Leptospira kmetyi]
LRSEGLNISMGGQSQGGFFNDLFNSFQQSMGYAMDGNGGLDENGAFSISTCFTAGTLIHTKSGTKKIEEIAIGDQVLSWNEETGRQEYNKVTATFVRDTNEIYTLVFVDGKQVETTWNHPFRRLLPEYSSATTPTKLNSEWVEAKDLKAGDLTFTKEGKLLQIGFIHVDEREETVYNFTVENDHDYYVGEVGILVHNVDCGPLTGNTLSPQVIGALLKLLPGATAAEIEAARKAIEIGNRPVDGTLEAAFDLAGYIDAACKNGCPPDIAMAPVRLGISAAKVAGELIRSGRFKEAVQVTAAAAKNWFKGADNVIAGVNFDRVVGTSGKTIKELAEANLTDTGKTVLGHFPGYIDKAQVKGSSYFDVGDNWNLMTPVEREAANMHFLDVVTERKDQILLSVPITKIQPNSALEAEVKYLIEKKGYVWVNQWSLKPKD